MCIIKQHYDTPLHNASLNLHNMTLEMLLIAGANPSTVNQITDYRKHVHKYYNCHNYYMLYTNQVYTVFMCVI